MNVVNERVDFKPVKVCVASTKEEARWAADGHGYVAAVHGKLVRQSVGPILAAAYQAFRVSEARLPLIGLQNRYVPPIAEATAALRIARWPPALPACMSE